MPEILRVSAHSKPKALAGAIAGILRRQRQVQMQAVGPAAVNQAVKAIAISRGYILADRLDLTVQPSFSKLEGEQAELTAMTFMVFAYVLPS